MTIFANIGVPMIFIHWPLMLCALVPVIILEALLIRRWVSLSAGEAFIGVGKANVLSTLVGVPLAWLAMLALEFTVMLPLSLAADKWKWEFDSPLLEAVGFLFTVAWLGPAEGYLHWMVPAAVGLLLVPCFYLSVLLERRSCVRTWTSSDRRVYGMEYSLRTSRPTVCCSCWRAAGWHSSWLLKVRRCIRTASNKSLHTNRRLPLPFRCHLKHEH